MIENDHVTNPETSRQMNGIMKQIENEKENEDVNLEASRQVNPKESQKANQIAKQKYKLTVAYDGTNYSGFQVQPNHVTIQGVLQDVLQAMHRRDIKVTGSGRTDAGVHAQGQTIHFESELTIPDVKWVKALNSMLPEDIRVLAVEEVDPTFHARFDVVQKEYRYKIDTSNVQSPFRRYYAFHVPYSLCLSAMREAAALFVGTHDFTAFSSVKSDVEDKRRTIYALDVIDENGAGELVIRCVGNGFLYNMVRIIVGTLIEVGKGRLSIEQVQQALQVGERELSGPTAPPHGLYLWKVSYDK